MNKLIDFYFNRCILMSGTEDEVKIEFDTVRK